MTQRFILDENIVILAQKLENDREERDTTSRRLLDNIIDICHTIVLDPILWGQYQHQLSSLPRDQPMGPRSVMRIMYSALQIDGKIAISSQDASSFPEEGKIPAGSQDDVPIVRLAVESGATLVTTDQALREDLNSCGVQEKYNLDVLSPDEALMGL